ncbi:MAG TPA: hypothetical protein V6C64_04055 [Microcoleaceae cyanobacterium]|jgi:hypothetical protein
MSKLHRPWQSSYLLPVATLLGAAAVTIGVIPTLAQEMKPVEAQQIERHTSGVSYSITPGVGYYGAPIYSGPVYGSVSAVTIGPEGASFSVSTPVVTGYPVRYPGGYPVPYPVGYPNAYPGGYGRSINNSVLVNPTIINSQIKNSTLVNPTIVSPQRPAVYRAAPYYGSGRSVIRYPAIEVYPTVYGY